MIRVVFNAFFTEIFSQQKEFVCFSLKNIFKPPFLPKILYIPIFVLYQIFSIQDIDFLTSSIENFILFFIPIMIFYIFLPIFTLYIFIDKKNIKVDISQISSNLKASLHMLFVFFGILYVLFNSKIDNYVEIVSLIVLFFIFIKFNIRSIDVFLFFIPICLYFYMLNMFCVCNSKITNINLNYGCIYIDDYNINYSILFISYTMLIFLYDVIAFNIRRK